MASLKVLQWNVWYLENKENLLELIKELDPDVICLQELTTGSLFQDGVDVLKYLAEKTGMHYYQKVIPNMIPSDEIGDFANGILSKYEIEESMWQWIQEPKAGGKDYDDQYRLYIESTVNVKDTKITIGTAHISYTHRFQDTDKRKIEADTLVSLTKKHSSNYIFTGDLNSPPGSYLITKLQESLVNCGPVNEELTWTTKPFDYQGFKEDKLNWRLDYVFASRDMKVVNAEIIGTKYSDHLPIFVTFEL